MSNIWIAASDNKLDQVKTLIESKQFNSNSKDPNGYTPIHAAVSYGYIDLLNYLLENGGNINIQDNEGDTPLHHVEDLKIAKYLIEKLKADYKIKNNDGLTAQEFIEEEDEFPEISNYLKSLIHDKPEESNNESKNNSNESNEIKKANEFLESLPEPGKINNGHEIKYSLQSDTTENDENLTNEELQIRRDKIEKILNSENPEEGLRELVTNAVHEGLLSYQQESNDGEDKEEPNLKKQK
ncbi:uncharacterized protein KGF55_001510 [Candida pseudojiufengensis]|uniref:uncharacterized protein n=1 Tax=Candida pseudojiufengensis TaxID=497109 RepID=UPI0022251CA6|nr:uncharacterized protein KGF55_001510 [Candida pseudojiufengensis]KAI5965290.1 hypothetical protein KGF55_001510 [Candida pseudojiufengensis]